MGIVRKTKTVKTMLDVFEQSDEALSGATLVDRFQDEMNKTTVYRILDRLEDEGVLHSFTGDDGLKWYARGIEPDETAHNTTHPHFQCRSCGKTECLDVSIDIPKVKGHNIDAARVLLLGYCNNCKA